MISSYWQIIYERDKLWRFRY